MGGGLARGGGRNEEFSTGSDPDRRRVSHSVGAAAAEGLRATARGGPLEDRRRSISTARAGAVRGGSARRRRRGAALGTRRGERVETRTGSMPPKQVRRDCLLLRFWFGWPRGIGAILRTSIGASRDLPWATAIAAVLLDVRPVQVVIRERGDRPASTTQDDGAPRGHPSVPGAFHEPERGISAAIAGLPDKNEVYPSWPKTRNGSNLRVCPRHRGLRPQGCRVDVDDGRTNARSEPSVELSESLLRGSAQPELRAGRRKRALPFVRLGEKGSGRRAGVGGRSPGSLPTDRASAR